MGDGRKTPVERWERASTAALIQVTLGNSVGAAGKRLVLDGVVLIGTQKMKLSKRKPFIGIVHHRRETR